MDELKYIKGLVREYFDIEAVDRLSCSEEEFITLFIRKADVVKELKELSGFDKDE